MTDHLIGNEWLAKCLTSAGIGDRLIDTQLRKGERLSNQIKALVVEVAHDRRPTLVLAPDEIGRWHHAIVEVQSGGIAAPPPHLLKWRPGETNGVSRDKKDRDP